MDSSSSSSSSSSSPSCIAGFSTPVTLMAALQFSTSTSMLSINVTTMPSSSTPLPPPVTCGVSSMPLLSSQVDFPSTFMASTLSGAVSKPTPSANVHVLGLALNLAIPVSTSPAVDELDRNKNRGKRAASAPPSFTSERLPLTDELKSELRIPAPRNAALAVGYRFSPTGEELINHYIRQRLNGNTFPGIIEEQDVYGSHPSDLLKESNELYCFSWLQRASKHGSRVLNIGGGRWKLNGIETVRSQSDDSVIGLQSSLTLSVVQKEPSGLNAYTYHMDEYRSKEAEPNDSGSVLVACKITKDKKFGGYEFPSKETDPNDSGSGSVDCMISKRKKPAC